MFSDQEGFPEEGKRSGLADTPVLGIVWDILSVILLLASLIIALIFMIIFINPQSGVNPLPPTTIPPPILTSTPSPTPRQVLPPTWTPGPSPTSVPTEEPEQPTATQPAPTETREVTAEPSPAGAEQASFVLTEDSPTYQENYVHQDAGCEWLGVAGQAFDENEQPVESILVETGGFLGENEVSFLTLTGMAEEYGPGGYEIELAEEPVASQGTVWIQLLDQTNLPFSEKVYFDTYDSCDQNLIVIDFIQESPEEE